MSRLRGGQLTSDEFLNIFLRKYPKWNKKCGITNTSDLIDIARELTLCNVALALRNKVYIKKLLKDDPTLGILVLTDIEKNDPNQDLHHCRLLIKVHHDLWELFHPDQSGQDKHVSETEHALEAQYAHFLVLG